MKLKEFLLLPVNDFNKFVWSLLCRNYIKTSFFFKGIPQTPRFSILVGVVL